MSIDLFGEEPEYFNVLAYPAAPGSGPKGATCRTCIHCTRQSGYIKCGLMSGSKSEKTDIRLKSKACAHWSHLEGTHL